MTLLYPSRRVGGGRKSECVICRRTANVRRTQDNVAGRYPSRKMDCIIQFESHKVELPHIYQLEHDDSVLEYYDQPMPIKLDYPDKNGRNLGIIHTPDYFVIREDGAGWEECKTEEELKKLAKKSPNRYIHIEEQWRSPPGENYTQSYGLDYRLWSDKSINWTLQGNLVFLEDYYRAETLNISKTTENCLIELVTRQQGIKLSELLNHTDDTDDIYSLIALEKLYVNLTQYSLTEPTSCPVFLNYEIAQAYVLMQQPSSRGGVTPPLLPNFSQKRRSLRLKAL